MNSTNEQDVNENDASKNESSLFAEEGVPTKKRKLSMGETLLSGVQLKVLQYENEKLKELVEELANEKLQQQNDSDELNGKIIKLESTIAELASKNEQSEIKIKSLENKNQEYEAQIKELNDQNSSMTNIKAEIKDSVEEERESAQKANENFIDEIKESKKRINDLEQTNQKLFDCHQIELQNLRQQKEAIEKEVQNLKERVISAEKIKLNNEQKLKAEIDDLKKKCNDLQENYQSSQNRHEMEIKNLKKQKRAADKEVKNFKKSARLMEKLELNNVQKMKSEIDELSKKTNDLQQSNQNHETEIKNLKQQKQAVEKIKLDNELKMKAEIDDLKKKLTNVTPKVVQKILESSDKSSHDEPAVKKINVISSSDSDDEPPIKKPTPSKSIPKIVPKKLESSDESSDDSDYDPVVKILNITKLKGTNDGWLLYSADDISEKPRLLTHEAMIKAKLKLNISGQVLSLNGSAVIRTLMRKINHCDLKVLHLVDQTISLDDYIKLVSSRKVEICILQSVFFAGVKGGIIDTVLCLLPCVKEFKFKYKFYIENHSETAKNLSKLPSFGNLQKFEFSNLSPRFKLEDIEAFLQKNNIDASYVFSYDNFSFFQDEIKKTEINLLKSLPLHRNISVVFE